MAQTNQILLLKKKNNHICRKRVGLIERMVTLIPLRGILLPNSNEWLSFLRGQRLSNQRDTLKYWGGSLFRKGWVISYRIRTSLFILALFRLFRHIILQWTRCCPFPPESKALTLFSSRLGREPSSKIQRARKITSKGYDFLLNNNNYSFWELKCQVPTCIMGQKRNTPVFPKKTEPLPTKKKKSLKLFYF